MSWPAPSPRSELRSMTRFIGDAIRPRRETIPIRAFDHAKNWFVTIRGRPGRRRAPFRNPRGDGFRSRRFEKRKHVPIAKGASLMTTEVSTQIGGPTAENQRDIDPAR